ncbi:glycosyltransferase family 4 protein [Maribacter luteus]|uniref:glycosyltransferase family 4 protein n=1 Tax=Maribacter luteus TaxID=2594478 RepID=UPI00248FD625|nr:glycosyltransferase family 4 protein [Maribacter luteus]
MRIFLISNMYPSPSNPDYGVFVRNFKEKMEDKGVAFTNISVIKGRSSGKAKKLFAYIRHYLSVLKNYRKNDYDLIYVHFISHNAPILALLLLLFSKKTPIVVNVHGSDVIIHNKGILRIFNSLLLKQTDLVVVPSSYFKDIVKSKFQFYKKANVFVNPSGGIDLTTFYPEKPAMNKYRRYNIGYVSRIDEGKGWNHFLEALSILKNEGVKFKAKMIGKGNQIESLKLRIKELSLDNEVVYKGALKQEELRKVYNSLDIFIFPSTLVESLGLVGLEAMACGVPVIASDMAGPKTYVIDGENGFLTYPGDISKIAECLKEYENYSKDKKEMMKEFSVNTAKKYDSQRTANNLYNELKKLME